jgi:hypothetical protein
VTVSPRLGLCATLDHREPSPRLRAGDGQPEGLRYQGSGGDVDLYIFGRDAAPLVCEVKARASGEGFATLEPQAKR